jgi:hypothetical protein
MMKTVIQGVTYRWITPPINGRGLPLRNKCILSGSNSVEGAHVIGKGPECEEFKSAYHHIYPYTNYVPGVEDIGNILFLREDYHRGPMDNCNLPFNLRKRRIGFDFINKVSYIENSSTGEIKKFEWQYVPNVKREYFAWSNKNCKKSLRKYLRRIDRTLVDHSIWASE